MQRVWGRDDDGNWVAVTTDANGSNDAVNCTWLAQALLLNINESPFFGQYGIPDQQSVLSSVAPDFYMAQMQALFAPFFASLIISRVAGAPEPTYNVNAITNQGAAVFFSVPY